MKRVFSLILILLLVSFCACGKESLVDEYAKEYKLMNKDIVNIIESDYVDYSSGWCKFSSEALWHANNRCGHGEYEKISSFSKIIVTKGQIGGQNYDTDPYNYIVHGYIIGSDTFGRTVQYNCNLVLHCSLITDEITYDGLVIDI